MKNGQSWVIPIIGTLHTLSACIGHYDGDNFGVWVYSICNAFKYDAVEAFSVKSAAFLYTRGQGGASDA
jgi:hypothetical protein